MKLSQRKFAELAAPIFGASVSVTRNKLQAWDKLGILSPIEKQGERKASRYSEEQLEDVKRILQEQAQEKTPHDEAIDLFDKESTPATNAETVPTNGIETDNLKDNREETITAIKTADNPNADNVQSIVEVEMPTEKKTDSEVIISGDDSNSKINSYTILAGATTFDEIKDFNQQKSTLPTELAENFNAPITIDSAPASDIITISQRADRIRKLTADVQRGIIEIGFELIAAKKEIGHGGWGDWLKQEFDWTDRTARSFMAVAERFGNRKTFSDLKLSTLQAMLKLPSGDEEEFIEAQAAAGKPVESQTAREVQHAVKEWNQHDESYQENTPSFEENNTTVKISEVIVTDDVDDSPIEKPLICLNTGNNEWYTPSQYIEAARLVMGGIDLDPASCELANQTVKATKFFSADDDGLSKDWKGRIWLNPPYASNLINQFVDKFLASNFEAAIVLTDAATETRWFTKLAQKATIICFPTQRIKFLRSDGSQGNGNPTRGSAFFYFGNNEKIFFSVFQKFGWCARSITKIVEAE